MKLTFAVALFAPLASLVACEGEPPINAPENPSGTASAAPSVEVPSMAPAASAASEAGADAPAPPPSTAVAAVAPAPAAVATRANITGTVTTKPAALGANAVVYLEDGPQDAAAAPPSVVVANHQMTFQPFIQVVAAGGKVVFTNDDPFPHNVFSPDNEKFNLGNIAQKSSHPRVFEHPGTYTLLCNLHPGMLGYVVVTPSVFFAKAGAKGKFTLKDVPGGTYHVTAWAPRQTPVTQSVTVNDGDVTVDFDLHR